MSDVQELNINNSTYDIKAKSITDQNGGKLRFWTGTRTQYEAIATKDSNTLYWLTDAKITYLGNNAIGNFKGGRNIGEIVSSSLPLTDAGLHLLDGSLLQYGIYKEFIDYIADLYAENPSANYFTTEALWQQSITDYGSCGKFVYDSTNNTVRLPKISDILQGTTDVSALGDLVKAGLPTMNSNGAHTHTRGSMNITGSFVPSDGVNSTSTGCVYDAKSSGYGEGGGTAGQSFGFHQYFIDASRSWTGSTSSNGAHSHTFSGISTSSTVQPQTIKCFVYIVIATSTKTDIEVNIDKIATDLNGKADTDLTNVTDTAKVLMSGMGMPSNKYVDLTLGASGASYTAPADGYVVFRRTSTAAGQILQLTNNGSGLQNFIHSGNASSVLGCYLPVKKGDIYAIAYTLGSSANQVFRFIYAVGSESEAN